MIVKGITIHNTGNSLTANQNAKILNGTGKSYLCHFIIDEDKIVNMTPLDRESYHTGKGYDMGNMNTIAIEISRSTAKKTLYMKAQKNAIAFIRKLMEEYGLTKDDIYFHNDFNRQAYCPHRILEIYGDKKTFLKELDNV